MSETRSTVIFLGDYDFEYPREELIRRGLVANDVRVRECKFRNSPLFPGPKKALFVPYFYLVLFFEMRRILASESEVDAVVVSKFNPLVLPFAAYYSRRLGCPLAYDLFVSLSETAAMRDYPWPAVELVHLIERVTYRLPTHHFVGTDQFADRYATMYGIPRERFVRLPPGADEELFHPLPDVEKAGTFTAMYWGNFLPHHGVDTILDAAEHLVGEDVAFRLIGSGPHRERAEAEARRRDLDNVEFPGRIPKEELPHVVATAHVCFGMFSAHPRAMASISTKVSEAVATRKAVVAEASPALKQWFEHRESIYFIPPEDGAALADALCELRDNPDLVARLEDGGYEVYREQFSNERIGETLVSALDL